jgi:prevent-host-death family protein
MNIGTFEAKTHFSEIIDEVQRGRDYVITKRGKPVAKIVPFSEERMARGDVVNELSAIRKTIRKGGNILEDIREGRK